MRDKGSNSQKKSRLTKLEKNWIMYDIGNSAFTLLVSTIIPIYFKNMATSAGVSAANSTAYLSYAISISTIIVAILGPVLGSVADNKDFKKPLFTFFMMMGVIACAALSMPKSWIMFLAIFVIGKVGFSGSLIFYDSMLVDITTDEKMDEVSSYGYAWGYIGSCVPFIFSLVFVLFADKIGISGGMAMAIAFLVNAVWWFVITLPLLKNYKQVYYAASNKGMTLRTSVKRLSRIVGELRNNKKILFFLIAFFFYIDGVYTIIDMATSYGKDVGITDTNLLLALLLTQFVAFPCSILFGKLAKKFETGKLIEVCIFAYFVVSVMALGLTTAWQFWAMASFVGVFQGAIQALSRSYYAKIIPKEKASEYFGIYDIFGKGAAFMGTMLMGITTQLTGSSRKGVLVVAAMIFVGFLFFEVQRRTAKGEELETFNTMSGQVSGK